MGRRSHGGGPHNRQAFAILRERKALPTLCSNLFTENYFRAFKGSAQGSRYDSCPYREEHVQPWHA